MLLCRVFVDVAVSFLRNSTGMNKRTSEEYIDEELQDLEREEVKDLLEATHALELAQDKLQKKEREVAEATSEVERATSELDDGITEHFGHRTAKDIKYIKGQLDTESSADQ